MARSHLLLALLFGSLVAACGGDSSSPGSNEGGGGGGGQPSPPSNQGIPIRGGERLVWDQVASSVQTARSYSYRLYIDGQQSALSDLRCNDTGSSAGYECSGRLPSIPPGLHTLEVAAASGGLQSPTSSILVLVAASTTTAISAEAGNVSADPSLTDQACVSTEGLPCYDAQLVADGLSSVTALIFTPDDRAFFIEGGQRIREIRHSELIALPLLSRESASARLISIAVARDFASTHIAFVAWSEPTNDGRELLNVTRYREVGGSFGEGATIVANLSIPANSTAPLATDEQGQLYLALAASEGAAESGAILRFDFSGAVPSTNPMYSPVVSSGYAVPSGLVWDGVSRQLWAVGLDGRWSQPLLVLPVAANGKVESPVAADFAFPRADGSSVPAVAVSPHRAGSDERFWLIAAQGRVFRGDVASRTLSARSFGSAGTSRAIAEGSNGQLLVVTDGADGSVSTAIWRMTSRSSTGAGPQKNISSR